MLMVVCKYEEELGMNEHGKNGTDQSGFHYDNCAGGPCNCDERRYGYRRTGGDFSLFRGIAALIGGFLLMVAIVMVFGLDIEIMSGFALFALWIGSEIVVTWIILKIEGFL